MVGKWQKLRSKNYFYFKSDILKNQFKLNKSRFSLKNKKIQEKVGRKCIITKAKRKKSRKMKWKLVEKQINIFCVYLFRTREDVFEH